MTARWLLPPRPRVVRESKLCRRPGCGAWFERRPGETDQAWAKRDFCSHRCGALVQQRRAREGRATAALLADEAGRERALELPVSDRILEVMERRSAEPGAGRGKPESAFITGD